MKRVPMMPVRDMVIFPQMMQPFIVGREASVRALEEALAGDKKIFLATQHDASVDDPKPDEIYAVGHAGQHRAEREAARRQHPRAGRRRGARQALSDRQRRRLFPRHPALTAGKNREPSPQMEQLVRRVTGLFEQYVKLSQSLNYDTMIAAARVDDPAKLVRHHRRQPADFPSRKSRTCWKTSIRSTG